MATRKPVNRLAPRVPPVKYFAILHGTALMVGTDPGPGGDDFGRRWSMLNKAGILPAHDMAARYFLFGESGCAQIGAKAAAQLAARLGGSLETLVSGENWRLAQSGRPRVKKSRAVSPRKTAAATRTKNPKLRGDKRPGSSSPKF